MMEPKPSIRLHWADISPYRAVLYEIREDNPFNRKIASVEYDYETCTFMACIHNGEVLFDAETELASKIEAQEHALAMLVVRRMEQAM
jgi:hypothetical protein